MILDVRGLPRRDAFIRVRDGLKEMNDTELITVIESSEPDAKKMKSFLEMSGMPSRIYQENDHWAVASTCGKCRCV